MARSRPSESRTYRIERLAADKETERVPGRVQVDPHMFLRLEICQYGAGLYRVLPGLLEIVDLDVEVHHHLLVL